MRSAELWRYTLPNGGRPVRVTAVRVAGQASTGTPLWIDRRIPTRTAGRSGYLRVVVTAGGASKVVTVAV